MILNDLDDGPEVQPALECQDALIIDQRDVEALALAANIDTEPGTHGSKHVVCHAFPAHSRCHAFDDKPDDTKSGVENASKKHPAKTYGALKHKKGR
jgi:hypothetical protein